MGMIFRISKLFSLLSTFVLLKQDHALDIVGEPPVILNGGIQLSTPAK